MNYEQSTTNKDSYTPLSYRYTCADISKEQKQLARDRMAEWSNLNNYVDEDFEHYKFDGKYYSLRGGK